MANYQDQWRQALIKTHLPQPLVPDSQFLAETGANARPYQTALAQLPENITAAASDYGYSTDAQGGITGVDASNPYSRAALLQRSYENAQRGNTTGYAARGLRNSGAFQRAQDTAFTNFNQASTENRRSFEGLIRGYQQNLSGLADQRDIANVGSAGGLTERAASDPNQVQVRTGPGAAPPAFFGPNTRVYKPKKKALHGYGWRG